MVSKIKSYEAITYEQLGVMERIILLDAMESRGELIGFYGSSQDKSDYESLVDKGLLSKTLVKSGRSPEFGYRPTQKGYEVFANREDKP